MHLLAAVEGGRGGRAWKIRKVKTKKMEENMIKKEKEIWSRKEKETWSRKEKEIWLRTRKRYDQQKKKISRKYRGCDRLIFRCNNVQCDRKSACWKYDIEATWQAKVIFYLLKKVKYDIWQRKCSKTVEDDSLRQKVSKVNCASRVFAGWHLRQRRKGASQAALCSFQPFFPK